MYDWVTHTWNTVKGKCPISCSYCYMKRFTQKPIHFDHKELKTDLGVNNIIFVGSSCDMFANAIPEKWIRDTIEYTWKFKSNSYLYQSKNPKRFIEFRNKGLLGDLERICTTIETNREYKGIMNITHNPGNRSYWLSQYPFNRYLTIEPIMDFDMREMIYLVKQCNPVQVNIGADSGHNHLPEPSYDKIKELIDEISKFTIVSKKKNLNRLMK